MSAALQIAHWIAGLIVLAEALNKLERTAPCAPGLCPHARLVDGLKALAWVLLAIGAAGAVFAPLLAAGGVAIAPIFHAAQDACVIVGFAVLIVRTRVKEG